MSDTPHIAQKAPFAMPVEAGKTYFWCTCGQSKKQPYCDGSHKGSTFSPLAFTPAESKTAYADQTSDSLGAFFRAIGSTISRFLGFLAQSLA